MNSTILEVKSFIRSPYAWPGGHPLVLVMSDGEVLCQHCAKRNFRLIVSSTKSMSNDGWEAAAVDVNYEDNELYCANCNEQIQSAFVE